MSDAKGYFGACQPHDFPLYIPDSGPAYWIGGTTGQPAPPAGYPVSFKKFFPGGARVTGIRLNFVGFIHDEPEDLLVMLAKPDPFERRIRRALLKRGGWTNTYFGSAFNFTISSDATDLIPLLTSGGTSGTWAATNYETTIIDHPGAEWITGFSDLIGAVATGCWFLYISDGHVGGSGQIEDMSLEIDAS